MCVFAKKHFSYETYILPGPVKTSLSIVVFKSPYIYRTKSRTSVFSWVHPWIPSLTTLSTSLNGTSPTSDLKVAKNLKRNWCNLNLKQLIKYENYLLKQVCGKCCSRFADTYCWKINLRNILSHCIDCCSHWCSLPLPEMYFHELYYQIPTL